MIRLLINIVEKKAEVQLKQSSLIKRLREEIKQLNIEIAKKDSIIKLQSDTNKLLVSHLNNVIKLEQSIKNNNLKLEILLNDKILQ